MTLQATAVGNTNLTQCERYFRTCTVFDYQYVHLLDTLSTVSTGQLNDSSTLSCAATCWFNELQVHVQSFTGEESSCRTKRTTPQGTTDPFASASVLFHGLNSA
ncbi:hypothetical protein Q8A73_004002 [Channa argus]|nr:hypothetical protein Q8A73_004002 [Channa argus]